MNGIETLKAKLIELGATKNQVESRVVELTITALAGEKENNADYLLKLLDEVKAEYKQKAEIADYAKEQQQKMYEALQNEKKMQEKKQKNIKETINTLNLIIDQLIGLDAAIGSPETAEMRDRMRAVNVLKSNSKINTCYDNTAFIKALGNILSGIREVDEPKQDYEEQKRAKVKQPDPTYKSIHGQLEEIRKKLNSVTIGGVTYRI